MNVESDIDSLSLCFPKHGTKRKHTSATRFTAAFWKSLHLIFLTRSRTMNRRWDGERGPLACRVRRLAEHPWRCMTSVRSAGRLPVPTRQTGRTVQPGRPRSPIGHAGSWVTAMIVRSRIGSMNRRVGGPGLHGVGRVPSRGGSWRGHLVLS